MQRTVLLSLSLLALNAHATDTKIEPAIKPTKSGMYDVGGFKLYLECFENDKPKLIVEQGFGRWGSDGVWLKNIEQLSENFSICLYDRSGLGKSEKGPVPFTVNDMAQRLHKLLEVADIKPPYYFAGASYGSYVIKSFHNQYPQEVSGAVLIDPPAFGYFHTMATRWPKDFKTDNKALERMYLFEQSVHDPMFHRVPENVDHMKSHKQLSNALNFGDKPVITIRSKPRDEPYDPPFVPKAVSAKMDELEQGAEKYFKGLSDNSKVVYSTSPKHHLHIADPELVVKEIRSLLQPAK